MSQVCMNLAMYSSMHISNLYRLISINLGLLKPCIMNIKCYDLTRKCISLNARPLLAPSRNGPQNPRSQSPILISLPYSAMMNMTPNPQSMPTFCTAKIQAVPNILRYSSFSAALFISGIMSTREM